MAEFYIYAYMQNETPMFIYSQHKLTHRCLLLASGREEALGHLRGHM